MGFTTKISQAITKKMLTICVPKEPLPTTIPRSGREGREVNQYSVIANNRSEDRDYLLRNWKGAKGESEIEALILGEDGQTVTLELDDMYNLYRFTIKHYWGLNDLSYRSPFSFLVNHVTKALYIRLIISNFLSELSQFAFNRKGLVSSTRDELLKSIVKNADYMAGKSFTITSYIITAQGLRVLRHPSFRSHVRRVKLLLDSLVSTGELHRHNGALEYRITDKALTSVHSIETDERHFSKANRYQLLMLFFTGILAVSALSEIILDPEKLSTICNFVSYLTEMFSK